MATELRATGVEGIGDVPWGTHVCHFYETEDDLLDVLIPFFRTGLDQRECCIWVIFDPLDARKARDALQRRMPDAGKHLDAGDLRIFDHAEWYLTAGRIDPDKVTAKWSDALRNALARGYEGLRVNGIEAWVTREHWADFTLYERALNSMLHGQRMLVLCTYPLARSTAVEIFDVAQMHEFVIARRRGSTQLFETPVLARARADAEQLRKQLAGRMRLQAVLEAQREVLQRIFDHVPTMIGFFDAGGRLKLVNREWEKQRGWSLDDVTSGRVDVLAESYPDPALLSRVREHIRAATGEWADFPLRRADGQIRQTTWANVRLPDGTTISIGQDITDRKRAEEQLRATTDQLRALTASLRSAREEEGVRIARELHDQLGSTLTSLRWDLDSLAGRLAQPEAVVTAGELRGKIDGMIELVDSTIQAVRRIASELRPSILDDLGLLAAIEWQLDEFRIRTGLGGHFERTVSDDLQPGADESTALFRILQEALTNIARHANASRVDISVSVESGAFVMRVQDDGVGIADEAQMVPRSLGLLGMRERARAVHASIEIRRANGRGTIVEVRLPPRAGNRST